MKIKVHSELSEIVRLGILRLSIDVSIPADGESLWREIQDLVGDIRRKFQGVAPSAVPGVDEARKLYRSVGIDPTKTRPSSEALVRRVIKGKDLYRIHPLVDLFNLVSLENLLPVGLYDESKIVGTEAVVRLGEAGWGFDGIRKDRVNVEGRLCVCDSKGPFGSPTSDSLRTSIGGAVDQALAVFFQHISGDENRMKNALHRATSLCAAHLSASVKESYIL